MRIPTKLRLSITLAFALTCTGSFGADTLTLAHTTEDLSRGYASWHSTDVRYTRTLEARRSVYLGGTLDTRFGQTDRTAYLGGSFPLNPSFTVRAEIGGGDNAILPLRYATAGVSRNIGGGLVLNGDIRTSWYREASTQIGIVGVEKYVGSFRFAGDVSAAHLSGTSGTSMSYRGSVDYEWSAGSSGGLFLAAGTESEAGPSGVATLVSRVIGARARWQLTENLTASVHVTRIRNLDAYSRSAVGASLDMAF